MQHFEAIVVGAGIAGASTVFFCANRAYTPHSSKEPIPPVAPPADRVRLRMRSKLGIRPDYAALYDMSPDANPLIGPVPGVDGLYVVCGSSGHGFKMGAAVGGEVARLVATKAAPLLAPFQVNRFAAAP
jgi:glycine/D-amino acid oxidase-like deaminating enzyme